jgi:aromatic ring-opening dioxygenase catalytic subunit (LigB family)
VAEIVLGIGTSHGPLLSTPPEQWDLRAKADRANKQHYYRGNVYDFESLLKERAPGFAGEAAIEVRRERHARCQRALDALGQKLRDVGPDALVIVGNDQREIFKDELTPAITVYRGNEIPNIPFSHEDSPGLAIAESGNCPPGGATYCGSQEFADHIITSLGEEGFDPAQSTSLPKAAARPGIPHAYGFVYHRILADQPPPSVPVILNVHYPPNRPQVRRCLALGNALRRAIKSWKGHQRVALVASGGLTHFVIDEEFDRKVLTAVERGDTGALAELPENYFRVGTAEIKNWLPVIAAMNAENRRFHKIDYVPCYRSEAGTGNAMAFVYWE